MSFRGFLDELKGAGLLKEIHVPVSPVLEVANRSLGAGPVMFQNVDGHRCCLNILGSRDLLARALGIRTEEMIRYLSGIEYESKGQIRYVNSSLFQEVVTEPDLSKLPILTYYR